MFSKVIVGGFKSFRTRQEIPFKPLTLLAGSNSSGKSSLMQSILLLKQTLQDTSDPGPLRINGPHVVFSRAEQMIWHAPGERKRLTFNIGLELSLKDQILGVESFFQRRMKPGGAPSLQVIKCIWSNASDKPSIEITPSLSENEIKERFSKEIDALRDTLVNLAKGSQRPTHGNGFSPLSFEVNRRRSFLVIEGRSTVFGGQVSFAFPGWGSEIERCLRQIIHVPGLRGNPQRTYPVRSIGEEYSGFFQEYVASIIAKWQRNRSEKIEDLNRVLADMKLTWKVRSYQHNDAEVELQVGRTEQPLRGGAKDVVNIADVGFGLSQSLPVIVALLAAKPTQLLYLEQPEIHLHPDAQVALTDLIVNAVNRGVQVVVETHSQLILLGIQRAIALQHLNADKVLLHWFARDNQGATEISSTTFSEKGAFDNSEIPLDFADISLQLMHEYLEGASDLTLRLQDD